MTLQERIDLLTRLGVYILEFDERLEAHMHRTSHANPWFTMDSQRAALSAIAEHYLNSDAMISWRTDYPTDHGTKAVGVVAAGNIPAVAFHDLLCVFITGHASRVKLSDRDPYLLPFLVKVMTEWDARVADYFEFVEKLNEFDAVIATGSNNTARYFEQYFGNVPNIIRKNRNAVALLTGDETDADLAELAKDIFEHFGLGCRNVSHAIVPAGFDVEKLSAPFESYSSVIEHSKYRNNFDYNLAIAMMNREEHVNLGNVLLKRSDQIISPIGCLHYSEYTSLAQTVSDLKTRSEEIQCVVSAHDIEGLRTVPLGHAQAPALDDYADGVDTMKFLTSL